MDFILKALPKNKLMDCAMEYIGQRRLMVIQEHNAKGAGLHWDLRIEAPGKVTTKVLRSWAIPKHRFPQRGEKPLKAIMTEDHPWDYQHFQGEIKKGYGAGTVKILFRDYVDVYEFSDTKIKFAYKDGIFTLFHPNSYAYNMWLIVKNSRGI